MTNMNERATLDSVFAALAADECLLQDFAALCDCGGRRAGSAGEVAALEFVHARLKVIDSAASVNPVAYAGWHSISSALSLDDGTSLACNPLLGSISTRPGGIVAEVVDLGRGTAEHFTRHADAITGRLVLVRHEYPFSTSHVHRRRKYDWAIAHGAVGFIIANPLRNAGPVSGSSGRGGEAGIPAVGTDFESAAQLTAAGAHGRARLELSGKDYAAQTSVAILDLPGKTDQRIVLSAHVDGHDLAESAMDNASGVAAALAIARAFAPFIAKCHRGLTVCLFSAEEWALAGSRRYLDDMPASERAAIALNINLDTLGGDAHLTALTSEFPRLTAFVRDAAGAAGMAVATYEPMMPNSDHYNFARHGIPALRLVAGFERPQCNVKYILTRGDTREKVKPEELAFAARLTAVLLARALTAGDEDIANLRLTDGC